MGKSSPTEKLDAVEALVRGGRMVGARTELQRLAHGRVPRESVGRFANLARRCELSELAVKVLNPLVRPSRKSPAMATAFEKSEYGASLIRLGAIDEGLELLESLDATETPEALLFRAFGLVARWDYAASIEVLRRYLSSTKLTPYQSLVGRVNLCAALVAEREESREALEGLLAELSKERHGLLRAKTLQLSAQASLYRSDWTGASRAIEEAGTLLSDAGPLDKLLLLKWRAIKARLENPSSSLARADLQRVHRDAKNLRHWETARQCDAYEAIAGKNRELALKVYFGTPFERFRARFLADLPFELNPPEFYSWGTGKKTLDVATGEILKARVRLKEGLALHHLLQCLSRDFYRSVRVATLHQDLHPGAYFDPHTSPDRVQKIVRRFRDWISKSGLPMQVAFENGGYLLKLESIALRVPRVAVGPGRADAQLSRLKTAFGDGPFTAAQASRALDVSPRSALDVLRSGEQKGLVARSGKARGTVYQISQKMSV